MDGSGINLPKRRRQKTLLSRKKTLASEKERKKKKEKEESFQTTRSAIDIISGAKSLRSLIAVGVAARPLPPHRQSLRERSAERVAHPSGGETP